MNNEFISKVSETAETIRTELDVTGESVVSCFDPASGEMFISRDYFDHGGSGKLYAAGDTIGDLFSALHRDLYQRIPDIRCIALFRSHYAMLWAQAGTDIIPHSILHVEHFYGAIPCTGDVRQPEGDHSLSYDEFLAEDIHRIMKHRTAREIPAILLRSYGPIVWGADPDEVLRTARLLEQIAQYSWELKCGGVPLKYLDYGVMNRYHTLYNKDAVSYMLPFVKDND